MWGRKEGLSEPVARTEAGEERALFLFAFLDGKTALAPEWTERDPFPPPAITRFGAVAALFSMVPVAEYCSREAERDLSNGDWLLCRTLYHAALLRKAMRSSPIYPVPFGTLFWSLESLRIFIRTHEERIGAFLRRVAGMEEWELKAEASFSSVAALEALALSLHPDWSRLPPGTRYMRLCRERAALLAAGFERAERSAAALLETLGPTALRRLLAAPAESGGEDRWGARFALLVPAEEADVFQEKVERLAGEAAACGVALALSGPWPPFSFRPDLPAPKVPGETAMAPICPQ